jgi:hypothetical protein
MTAESIKKDQKLPKLHKKTKRAIELVDNGVPEDLALQVVNNNRQISQQAISQFKQKLVKYSLTSPKTVKAAANQLSRILKAEPRSIKQQKINKDGEVIEYIEQISPPDSVIMTAIGEVYSRYQPATTQNLNVNVTVDPIDLGEYLNRQSGGK